MGRSLNRIMGRLDRLKEMAPAHGAPVGGHGVSALRRTGVANAPAATRMPDTARRRVEADLREMFGRAPRQPAPARTDLEPRHAEPVGALEPAM
jgi:hypothetical protein